MHRTDPFMEMLLLSWSNTQGCCLHLNSEVNPQEWESCHKQYSGEATSKIIHHEIFASKDYLVVS
jgi:hypothetical protein